MPNNKPTLPTTKPIIPDKTGDNINVFLIRLASAAPKFWLEHATEAWLKAVKKADCYYFDEVLARYRVRRNSLSHSGLKKSVKNQYRLFRVGEEMCAIRAAYHTAINMFFGVLKKIFYIK